MCSRKYRLRFLKRSRWLAWRMFFFFQAEDGIRDDLVTGVQTCALPIYVPAPSGPRLRTAPLALVLVRPRVSAGQSPADASNPADCCRTPPRGESRVGDCAPKATAAKNENCPALRPPLYKAGCPVKWSCRRCGGPPGSEPATTCR